MRQIDIGMTLDEKILGFLEGEDAYRSPKVIAEAIGETVEVIGLRCSFLYWDQKNGLQRRVCHANADNPSGTSDDVVYFVPRKSGLGSGE